MSLKRIQILALAVVLFGCGSSGDDNSTGDGKQSQTDGKPEAKPEDKPNDDPAEAANAGSGAVDELPADENEVNPDEELPPDDEQLPPDEMEEDPDEMTTDMPQEFPDIRGVGCSLDTGFPGDEACLAPPPEGEGMQIHIGPSNYDDADEVAKFVLHPEEETSQCWTFHTPNQEEVYYQGFVLSGRPGTHHIINTMYASELQDGGFALCSAGEFGGGAEVVGPLPGASKSYMPRRLVAPENAGLGRPIGPNTSAQSDMHYFNFTESDILREFWMNVYFIPKEKVTKTPTQIRGMGGFGWAIAPDTDHVYQYQAPIPSDGRITQLLGHYHAHGVRFSAYILRAADGTQEKVFEMYNYLDPAIFNYNTVEENPEFADIADQVNAAKTGMLEVKAGDVLQWECHIVNDSTTTLRYTNEVKTGEMCNIWGESVDTKIDHLTPSEEPFEIQE